MDPGVVFVAPNEENADDEVSFLTISENKLFHKIS